jgi:hypothetical protein
MNWIKAIVVGGVLCGLGASAYADINYTSQTTFSMPGAESKTTMTRAVKPNFERYEMVSEVGAYKQESVMIRECEKKQTIKLDSQLKIYAVVPDKDPGAAAVKSNKPGDKTSAPATGKMVMTYDVKDLGAEDVAGFKARHYMVEIKSQRSGCAGDLAADQKYEIWSSEIREPVACPNAPVPSLSEAMSHDGCKIEVVQQGDFKLYGEIGKGLTLRQKIYNEGKVFMTTEVTSLSQAKLSDELFSIPAGYKKVSEEDFDKQRNEAMVKAMTAIGDEN